MNAPAGRSTLRFGDQEVPSAVVVMLAGAALWLGIMLVQTGSDGFDALWTAALFLVPLALIATLTRTVRLWDLLVMFFAGGFMMGVAILALEAFESVVTDPEATSRDFFVPLIEETLKLIPLLLFLWIGRHGRTWSLGVTDVLLLGASAGAGFGLVEDAYIRDRFGWPDEVSWLPLAEIIGGRVIAGHAVWTTVAATGIGFALLLRSRGPVALLAGVAGLAWAVFDHAANNYGVGRSGGMADRMESLTGDGWVTIWLLVLGGIAAIGVDLWIQARSLPRLEELKAPRELTLTTWDFRLRKRELALAAFQYHQAGQAERPAIEGHIRTLVGELYVPEPASTPPAPAAPAGEASPTETAVQEVAE